MSAAIATPVYTVTDEDQMQANVYPNTSKPGWFNVTLRDLDSGEYVPTAYRFDTLGKAKAKADQLAGPLNLRAQS